MKFHTQMTKKEVFDAYMELARSGGFPCVNDKGKCQYRAGDRGCAIGVFLPDKLAKSLDTRGWDESSVGITDSGVYKECKEFLPDWMTVEVASELQDAHDDFSIEKRRMPEFAIGFFEDKLNAILSL